jgi:hypothetical protein
MSAGKISCRWRRPDRYLGASQAGLTPRLTPQESLDPEDLSRVHDVVGVDPPLDCAHNAHRPSPCSATRKSILAASILANEHTTAEIAAGILLWFNSF